MRISDNPINTYRDALISVKQANTNYAIAIEKLSQAVKSIEDESARTKCQRLLSMAIHGTKEIERILTQKDSLLSSEPSFQPNHTPMSAK